MDKDMTTDEVLARIDQLGASNIKLAVTDIDGVLRGKYVSRDKFFFAPRKWPVVLRRGAGLGFQRPAV